MNKRARSLSWIISAVLAGILALAVVLLILPGVFPGTAAWQAYSPDAITNPQKAAILGGQNLLRVNRVFYITYLPTLTNQ